MPLMHTGANRKSVARKTGPAESTVSRALSDSPLISEETKEIVRSAARAMGYTPNRQAALLSKRRTCRLGLVVPQYKNIPAFSRSYFPMILDGAVMAAEARGFFVTILLDRQGDQERDLVHFVRSREVDGLLLSILKKGDPRVARLRENDAPFVLINSEEAGVTCVNHDARPGMEKAFAHLAGFGHAHLGFVSGDLDYLNARDRLALAQDLSRKHRMRLTVADGNFSRTSGYYAAGKLLRAKDRPTAVLTSSDRQAIGVLEYCRDHDHPIPQSLSLISFDDFDSVSLVKPILSAISNPVREASMEAARLLIEMVEGRLKRPKTIRLDTGFIARESTGPSS
jgi:LacI family transcriptional regulator